MDAWLKDNIGTVITIVSFLVGFGFSYGKLKAGIASVSRRLDTLQADLDKFKDGGVPILCHLHDQRLTRLEEDLKRHSLSIKADVSDIKQLVKLNHDLIMALQELVNGKGKSK